MVRDDPTSAVGCRREATALASIALVPKHRPTNAEIEKGALTRFLANSGLVPGSEPERPDQDPPDFWVAHAGKRIAIEVTQLVIDGRSGSVLRSGENNRAWIKAKLEEELEDLAPLVLSIHFADKNLSKSEGPPLAARISSLVRSSDPSARTTELRYQSYLDRGEYGTVWPEALDSMRILRPQGFDRVEVVISERGILADPKVALQAAIDDKEASLPRYRARYDERWLLAVAECMGPSSFFESEPETRLHSYRSTFDRVFFQGFGEDWFELRRD